MKILLISRCPPYPLYLGDRLIVYHLVRQLARRGHSIDLIAFSDRFEDITERGQYADLFRQITIVADPPRTSFDYALRLVRPGARFPHGGNRAWSPAMWDAIRHYVTSNQYDVVHLFGGVQVYEYAHAVEPLPTIITPYESYSLYLRRVVENDSTSDAGTRRAVSPQRWITQIRERIELRTARSFESWMFSPYKRVVVVSERDRDELRGLNPSLLVEVIPNGVDLDYFQTSTQTREPNTILFTGNYEYAPNIDAALRLAQDLFPRIRERVPDAKLWIVGNAPPPELQALNDSEAITVTGRVPDMRTYLERASIFVCPLRLGAGIKNKVLEALALRLPVVATPLSVDGIAVRDGHEVLIAQGDDALVETTVRVLADPTLQTRLGANGRALIESRYSWRQVAERYEGIYTEVRA